MSADEDVPYPRAKKFSSGGKLLVLPKPRLEEQLPHIVVADRPPRPMVEGLSVDQLLPDRQRLRNSAAASAGLPVPDSRMPRLGLAFHWPWLRKPVSALLKKLVAASFCRIAAPCGARPPSSAGLPVPDSRMGVGSRWKSARMAVEIGVGGVVVGQLLPDRQRLAVLDLRLRWLAARLRQRKGGAERG